MQTLITVLHGLNLQEYRPKNSDGLDDDDEMHFGTDPNNTDTDGNGI